MASIGRPQATAGDAVLSRWIIAGLSLVVFIGVALVLLVSSRTAPRQIGTFELAPVWWTCWLRNSVRFQESVFVFDGTDVPEG